MNGDNNFEYYKLGSECRVGEECYQFVYKVRSKKVIAAWRKQGGYIRRTEFKKEVEDAAEKFEQTIG